MREHIAKINISNMAYLKPHNDIETPHSLRDYVIVAGTIKLTFDTDIQSTDKTCSAVKNLVKKKVITLGSKETDIIDNADIYDACKNHNWSEAERGKKLIQGI